MKDKISALVQNAQSFADKGRQVSPATLEAFGIAISSRYGKCDEIIDMLEFAQAAAVASVAHYVKEISFDSKACICSFELDTSVVKGTDIERQLFQIAKDTVGHFFWFDDEYFEGSDA